MTHNNNVPRATRAYALVAVMAMMVLGLAASAESANAAALNYSVDTNFTVGSNTYIVKSGSTATELSVSSSGFTVTTGVGESVTIESAGKFNYNFPGSTAISTTCTADVSRIVIGANAAGLAITPDTAATCTVPVSSSSSSGGASFGIGSGVGGSSAAASPSPSPTPPSPTPPSPSPSPSAGPVANPFPEPTPPPPAPTPPPGTISREEQIVRINLEAGKISTLTASELASAVNMKQDTGLEQRYESTIVARMVVASTPAATKAAIVNFVSYGTVSSTKLGAGERAGVVSSFKAAFGRLPSTEADWQDVLKIAGGRFPSQTSSKAESAAAVTFRKIFRRDAIATQQNDKAALTVMSYGLRPDVRRLSAESAAIKSFKAIYKVGPKTTADWDAVRAIAYSGAKR